jgi:hypothetical protein
MSKIEAYLLRADPEGFQKFGFGSGKLTDTSMV